MPNKKQKVAFHAKSIYDIDPQFFLDLKIKAVVTDLDNTLDPADVFDPAPRAKALVEELQKLGLRVLILSNNTEERCGQYCRELAVPYLSSSFKYWAFRIRKFLKKQGLAVEDCLFIGDQIYTDTLGGNRLGALTCYVETIDRGDFWIGARYHLLERAFIRRAKRRSHDEHTD